MPPASRKRSEISTPTPIDAKTIRRHIRMLIGSLKQIHQRDTPRQTHVILGEIWLLVDSAFLHLHNHEQAQALMTLQAVTNVCTEQWMYLNDFHSEVSGFFHDLVSAWTEVLLSVDLTAKERIYWAKQVTTWQTRLGDWSIREVFEAPGAAIREGWDDAALQALLQGTSSQQTFWEGEPPAYATVLIHARLTVLERRQQVQEYLRLAQATGQTKDYVVMLVRQGQIAEAIDDGLQHLATAEDAFAVAQELFAQGEHAPSFQIADHGLTLEGNRVPLALWLRDQSWSLGEQMLALKAGTLAFHDEPTLKHYLYVADIAGTHWPEQRAQLLDRARQASWSADPQGLVRLFLHEQLFDDAIAVLGTKQRYTLVAHVVEAALAEQVALEWVIQECRQQAEHIMNGAKTAYYHGAALWLTRARTAYTLLGCNDVWDAYLDELLERHTLKSKLLPLLRALKEGT